MAHYGTYTAAARLPAIGRSFLVFAGSPDAQRVIVRSGFLSAQRGATSLEAQGPRLLRAMSQVEGPAELEALQGVLRELEAFERLPLVLRPTAQRAQTLRALASLLDTGRFDGRTVKMVSFATAPGPRPSAPAEAALETVRELMITDPRRVEWRALPGGTTMPLACTGGPWAEFLNNRVEIWVGP